MFGVWNDAKKLGSRQLVEPEARRVSAKQSKTEIETKKEKTEVLRQSELVATGCDAPHWKRVALDVDDRIDDVGNVLYTRPRVQIVGDLLIQIRLKSKAEIPVRLNSKN